MTPNEMVIKGLFRFLKDKGVSVYRGQCGGPKEDNFVFYINNNYPPYLNNTTMRFSVRYIGNTGEVLVTELRGSWLHDQKVFYLCDPDCFDQVLEMVK